MTVFAVLVGITENNRAISLGDRQVHFDDLQGCVSDAWKIRAFLQTSGLKISIKELYDEQATKSAICNALISHLGQAKPGDATLFYFSGHGTEEVADPCFGSDTGKLESLVTFTPGPDEDFLLADTELRYMLGLVAKKGVTCTVIIDSCFSGGATRNSEVLQVNYDAPLCKSTSRSYVFKKRPWSSFIFSDKFTESAVAKKGLSGISPEANFILLSAAESNEATVEIAGEGIFTKHLVELLNLQGRYQTNRDLHDRLRQRMKFSYMQTPRLSVSSEGISDSLQKEFLTGATPNHTPENKVYFTPRGWTLNRGSLSGVGDDLRTILLIDPDNNHHTIQARIIEVNYKDSVVWPMEFVDTKKVYKADVESLSRGVLKLYLNTAGSIPKDSLALVAAIDRIPQHYVQWVGKEHEADFELQHLQGIYYLSKPDDPCRPVAEGVEFYEYISLIEQLMQLSRWKSLNELSTDVRDGVEKDKILKVEYVVDGVATPVSLRGRDATIPIDRWQRLRDSYVMPISIRFTNISDHVIYLAVLYMDVNFSSTTALLQQSPQIMEPGATTYLHFNDNTNLQARVVRQALCFNYQKYSEFLKIVVDEKPFDTYPLLMQALPEPPMPGLGSRRMAKTRESLPTESPRASASGKLFVSTIDLAFTNPRFNKVSFSVISEMLRDRITSTYAVMLYFDTVRYDHMPYTVSVGLRSEINLTDDGEDDNVLHDEELVNELSELAMVSWYQRRNRFFEEICDRFPERKKIVALGDTWLLHPLIKDTADYLSAMYAVRVFRWTTDTPIHSAIDPVDGKPFTSIIRETRPQYLLLSTGGDDLFGISFRKFLVDKATALKNRKSGIGARFLTESLDLELGRMMRNFGVIFGFLANEFPWLRVVIHGYDYPVGLSDPEKTVVGRTMMENGITLESDRKAVVDLVIDRFNQNLSTVANLFPDTVRYIDLRHSVTMTAGDSTPWDSEVIPNREGFQQVALRYIKDIEGWEISAPNKVNRVSTNY